MPYPIILSDSITTLVTVPDNTLIGPLETTPSNCSLNLVGRGSVNYGLATATNFVWMLQNFANINPPVYPLAGQLWYNTTPNAACLKVYNITGNWENVTTTSTTFTTTKPITISGSNNGLNLSDNSQPVDQKNSSLFQSNSVLSLTLINDAGTASSNVLTVTRNGYIANVVTLTANSIVLAGKVSMPMGATTVTQNSVDNTTNVATTAFVNSFTSGRYLPLVGGGTVTGNVVINSLTTITQNTNDSSQNVATTAYVANQITTQVGKVLSSNLYLYVSPTGSDTANTGLTSSSPFATLQHAWNTLTTGYIGNGYDVTINLANGTYTAGLTTTSCVIGFSSVTITGNPGSPSSVLFDIVDGCGINFSSVGTTAYINGMTFQCGKAPNSTTPGAGYGILVFYCPFQYQNINFGTCASAHVTADFGGNVFAVGTNTISGGALYHFNATSGGVINGNATSVTISGAVNFQYFAVTAFCGILNLQDFVYYNGGSVTGTQYISQLNGVIWTGTGTAPSGYFPGTIVGITGAGGIYL